MPTMSIPFSVSSATTAQIFVVPMSSPTISSSFLDMNPPFIPLSRKHGSSNPGAPCSDDWAHPCLAAACCSPLPRGGLGPQDCTVRVPEIDPTRVHERRLAALDEGSESRDAFRKESLA